MQVMKLLLLVVFIASIPRVHGYGPSISSMSAYQRSAAAKTNSAAPNELIFAVLVALKKFSTSPHEVRDILQANELTITSPLNSKQENALHLLANTEWISAESALPAFRELVQDDTDWDAVDSDGRTVLHHLAAGGDLSLIDFALSKKARVDLPDDSGMLPSDVAREAGHDEAVKLLDMYEEAQAMADNPNYTGGTNIEADNIGEIHIEGLPTDTVSPTDVNDKDLPDFMVNLNQRAFAGEIDPLIGRDKEIKRLLEVLGQRHNNNPVLVGLPGVGKTRIVEGLAHFIVKGQVPPRFRDKTIYEVSIGALTAGTGVRGALEEKVKQLVQFAEQHPEAIFFIDEIHLLTSGDTRNGVNIAEQLKPQLSAGKLPLIGATTPDEFRQHIDKFDALARRFVRINVAEPSKEEVIDIVLGLRDSISLHQGIDILDEAALAAIEYASYFKDKQLPFSAITLLDEAASSLALSDGFHLLHLNNLQAKIDKLTSSLDAQTDKQEEVQENIAQLKATYTEDFRAWQEQVGRKEELVKIATDINLIEAQIKQLEHDGKFIEADKLRKENLQELFTRQRELQAEDTKVLKKIHVAELVATKLKIPVGKILQESQEDLSALLPQLQEHILGQDAQLQKIVDLVIMTEMGLNKSPPPSFMLVGPSGVGKSETVLRLQSIIAGGRRELIRVDMSEFMEEHTASGLLGAPAGYVGYEDGSSFITKIKANPSAIILLDEIEKAHHSLHNILLQMLEGRLTSRDHEEIDLSQTMIFMTSNSENLAKDFSKPLRGRIDRTITYNALSDEIMQSLVRKEENELNQLLHSKGIVIKLHDDMIAALAKEGQDDDLGARALQHLFEESVTNPLSLMIAKGELNSGSYQVILEEGTEIKVVKDE